MDFGYLQCFGPFSLNIWSFGMILDVLKSYDGPLQDNLINFEILSKFRCVHSPNVLKCSKNMWVCSKRHSEILIG